MEDKRAAQESPYKIEPQQQSYGESVSETRRPSLPKPGGQYESGQTTAETKVEKETLMDAHANF
jgi:hypothetical protein